MAVQCCVLCEWCSLAQMPYCFLFLSQTRPAAHLLVEFEIQEVGHSQLRVEITVFFRDLKIVYYGLKTEFAYFECQIHLCSVSIQDHREGRRCIKASSSYCQIKS